MFCTLACHHGVCVVNFLMHHMLIHNSLASPSDVPPMNTGASWQDNTQAKTHALGIQCQLHDASLRAHLDTSY